MTNRLIIKGGAIVAPEHIQRGDILIVNDRIVSIAPEIDDRDADVVDASECYVLPGAIDAHVHMREPGAEHKEDFCSGTRAALAGGVTVILDMPNNPLSTTSEAGLETKRSIARMKAYCDYGFFFGATRHNAEEARRQTGTVGLKMYVGSVTGDLLVTDFAPLHAHFTTWPRGKPIVVHAEDNEALDFYAKTAVEQHSLRHPPICAALAVARVLAFAEVTGRSVHIAHLSTGIELAMVKAARARGVLVTCETGPQYLFLSSEDEKRLGGMGVMNPPLRPQEDVRALWEGLQDLDMVATDHAPHTWEEKQGARPAAGIPGLESMLPLLLTAVNEKRLALQDVARLASRNPANVFGLARKGAIAPGYDADLVLIRLSEEYVLRKPWQTKCNWSPFEGWHVRGRIARVFLRGREVLANGVILAEAGYGNEVTLRQL